MKNIFYFIIMGLLISCVSSKSNYNCVLSNAINKTIQQDFFDDYREEGKLNVVIRNKYKFFKLKDCLSLRNINLDSIESTSRYIVIEVSSYRVNYAIMQIGCHKESDKGYYIMYSTSYEVQEDCYLAESKYKPYIDSIPH